MRGSIEAAAFLHRTIHESKRALTSCNCSYNVLFLHWPASTKKSKCILSRFDCLLQCAVSQPATQDWIVATEEVVGLTIAAVPEQVLCVLADAHVLGQHLLHDLGQSGCTIAVDAQWESRDTKVSRTKGHIMCANEGAGRKEKVRWQHLLHGPYTHMKRAKWHSRRAQQQRRQAWDTLGA